MDTNQCKRTNECCLFTASFKLKSLFWRNLSVDLQKLSAFAGSSVFAPPQVGCSLFRLGKEFLENTSGASSSVILLRHELEKKLREVWIGLNGRYWFRKHGTGVEFW